MRRTLCALFIGGSLLAVAGCNTTSRSATPEGAAAPPPAVEPATRDACEAIGKVYNDNVRPFAEGLAKLVADRDAAAEKQARTALASFATAVRDATGGSADADIKADGARAADKLKATSADKTFFAGIKTPEDMNTVLGPKLKEWLAPVNAHCS